MSHLNTELITSSFGCRAIFPVQQYCGFSRNTNTSFPKLDSTALSSTGLMNLEWFAIFPLQSGCTASSLFYCGSRSLHFYSALGCTVEPKHKRSNNTLQLTKPLESPGDFYTPLWRHLVSYCVQDSPDRLDSVRPRSGTRQLPRSHPGANRDSLRKRGPQGYTTRD